MHLLRSREHAPPVLRLLGSTLITPMVFVGWSRMKRRISSSTMLLLPAPPVPVMPSTGAVLASAFMWISSAILLNTSGWFSAVLINLAMAGQFCGLSFFASPFTLSLRS